MRLACLILVTLAMIGCIGQSVTPLAGAARRGDVSEIKELIAHGADPNEPSGVNSWTPLMHAIHKNQKASVSALLDNRADVNRTAGRTTALIMAAGYGYGDIVSVLLEHGADPRARSSQGLNALDVAILGSTDIDRFTLGHCQTETIQALLSNAPDLKVTNSEAQHAIEAAKLKGCAVMERLVPVRAR
jgi:hypothetical protein